MSLLEVDNLTVRFGAATVVDGVSFALDAGERLGIIGESGSGKTLTALSVLGLVPPQASVTGSVRLDGKELLGLSDRALANTRGDRIAIVFQEPLSSLDPLMRVGPQIAESLRVHRGLGRRAAHTAALELATRVGLPDPERIVRAWPHELSGGQRQRAGIAAAIACEPELIVADEPTTALDVTVQAEILALLDTLVAEQGSSLLFITHDLAVMSEVARRVLVMQAGAVVDAGDLGEVLGKSTHPYTRKLLNAAVATSWQPAQDEAPTRAPAPAPIQPAPTGTALLEGRGLSRTYRLPRRSLTGTPPLVHAVRDVDVTVRAGENLGIVGESGSGKSTLLRILLALDQPDAGTLHYRGEPILANAHRKLGPFRAGVQIVLQDPASSLDPRWKVSDIVAEPLRGLDVSGDHDALVDAALRDVGLSPLIRDRYPHQFSGGERQRIAIARALVSRPQILVGDEPVSALDVSVRAQILDLLRDLAGKLDLTLVIVSHDIGVVAHLCDRMLVMKDGAVVEEGTTDSVLGDPAHAYTQRLLSSVPQLPRAA